jgi:2-amino-4-hydroxy-6-hydroxymethyldihydropteridine diphosphokinase
MSGLMKNLLGPDGTSAGKQRVFILIKPVPKIKSHGSEAGGEGESVASATGLGKIEAMKDKPGPEPCGDGCLPSRKRIYILGLGSNLGNRRRNLSGARRRLREAGVDILKSSSLYRTEPVDAPGQPWFLNQVVKVRTERTPHELLALAKSIEARLGRIHSEGKGPRPVDIDILLEGDTVVETPGLVLPHPRLARRNFVLIPLCEIAPEAVHPILGKPARDLLRECPDRAEVLKSGR